MIDNKVGSIEVGKDADLAIFDKHPLSNYAKVEKVFIDGQMYFDRDKDLAERPEHEAGKEDADRERERAAEEQPRPAARGGRRESV